ncbi:phasin family protein [Ramlibacter sp. PS3R-8]|uniref:phasin family protein n=1 Tax=Ramlibacter sp. PS3R-8 TaxID=3133437 RepID=UPI0030AF85C7
MAKNARNSEPDDTTSSVESSAGPTRESLARVAQGASTLLQGAQAFQEVQLQMLQRATLVHEQAAERLRAATSPAEVLALQGQMLVQGWQQAMQYGQELMTASMKVQGEMLAKAGQQQPSPADEGPVTFQAWQNVMLDALNGAGKH